MFYPSWGMFYPSWGMFYPSWGMFYPNSGMFYPNSGMFYPNSGMFYPNVGRTFPNAGRQYLTTGKLRPKIFKSCRKFIFLKTALLLARIMLRVISNRAVIGSDGFGNIFAVFDFYQESSSFCPISFFVKRFVFENVSFVSVRRIADGKIIIFDFIAFIVIDEFVFLI